MTSRREISRHDVTEASKIDVATWQRGDILTSRREISRRDVTERMNQDICTMTPQFSRILRV